MCASIFFFSPYFHQSRLQAVFILEDGFRENVFASPPPPYIPFPPFFFLVVYGTSGDTNKQVEQKMFLFISSQIIHSNDGKKILMTMTLAAWVADLSQL